MSRKNYCLSIVTLITYCLSGCYILHGSKYYKYEWCGEEFYRTYNPKMRIRICSNVALRKCVQKNYCKEDEQCNAEVAEYYKSTSTKNDEEYCTCMVKAEKGEIAFKICDAMR